MKKLAYLTLVALTVLVSACKKNEDEKVLSFEKTDVLFTYEEGETSLKAETSSELKDATSDADWCKATAKKNMLAIKVTENVAKEPRSASVTVKNGDGLSQKLSIVQDGAKYIFDASDIEIPAAGGSITAEYYAQNRPEFDMVFVAFSGEEANLRGSSYFAEHPSVPLESIKYLYNIDMIGDNNPAQYCEVSEPGMDVFNKMVFNNNEKHYFQSLHLGELAANSDHWPFAKKGVPCILFENEGGDTFPYYHTAGDNWDIAVFTTYEPIFNIITDSIR